MCSGFTLCPDYRSSLHSPRAPPRVHNDHCGLYSPWTPPRVHNDHCGLYSPWTPPRVQETPGVGRFINSSSQSRDNIPASVPVFTGAVKRCIMYRGHLPWSPRPAPGLPGLFLPAPVPSPDPPAQPGLPARPADLPTHPPVKYDITNITSKTEQSTQVHYTVVVH